MKAILFDLDGTIGNTLPLCIAAFREAIEPLAKRQLTDEEIIATFGPSEEGTIALLLPDKQTEGLSQYLWRYEALHGRWPAPFDGIVEILSYLKGKQLVARPQLSSFGIESIYRHDSHQEARPVLGIYLL
jgi:phosphoglycolate phosphatase/pyrophosphatase PpaX